MKDYKIGNKIVFETTRNEAYHSGLIHRQELSPGENKVFSSWGWKGYFDEAVKFHKKTNFYGKITKIEFSSYDGGPVARTVTCLFSNGRTLGFLDDDFKYATGLRKASILERLTMRFDPLTENNPNIAF